MQYIIFASSLVFIFYNNFISKNLLLSNQDQTVIKNRFLRLLKFIKYAPMIALFVLVVLVLSYFHSNEWVRLSHAWYDSQFWAYTALLYCFYRITQNKLTLIFTFISFFIAIYNTPLFHYEHLFFGRNVIVSDIFGLLMFLSMWITISKMTTTLQNKKSLV